VIADLDTLLTALYVELTDRIIPLRGFARSGPGKPPQVTGAELVCLAVTQVLLRYARRSASLGGADSLAVHPASMWRGMLSGQQIAASGVPPSLVRLAAGTEGTPDLIADAPDALR
jgi:hypothetical protein